MKKVSVLSPCYNVAKCLPTFLDSIIAQDYQPIELILVDDGSTDDTAKIIEDYKPKFVKNNIELKYIFKENGGQASAVALGIKEVTGEYLIWPDSDDFLLKNSILRRVEYMESHPDCGFLRTNGYTYHENDLQNPIAKISKMKRTVTLEDYMNFIVPWCPGCYMVRMSCFDRTNPDRIIAVSHAGQNIQMILPIVHRYPCHYLDECLYGYVIHPKSHSHSINTYEKNKQHLKNLQSCVEDTLKVINDDTAEYSEISKKFFRFSNYRTAWQYGEKDEMRRYENDLRDRREFKTEAYIMKYMKKSAVSDFLIRAVSKIRRTLKG